MPYTREISGTHSVSGMVGNRLISPANVNVVLPFILIMHYAVIRVVFLCIYRHNEIQDFTANVLTEVCHDVCVEPTLQELNGESLPHVTANSDDGARLEIRARHENAKKRNYEARVRDVEHG